MNADKIKTKTRGINQIQRIAIKSENHAAVVDAVVEYKFVSPVIPD